MNCSLVTTLAVVYRPPDTPVLDTGDMFRDLNITLISSRSSIVVGDFNIHRNWLDSTVPFTRRAYHEFSHFILDND